MSKPPPTHTYYKRSRPLPYCNPNYRTPRHWKFLPSHHSDHPRSTLGTGNSSLYLAKKVGIRYKSTDPFFKEIMGWSGGAMVLGKLPVPARPTYLDYSRAKAYCTCSRCRWELYRFFVSRLSVHISVSLSLWETARYRLEYCLKRTYAINNQQTNLQRDDKIRHQKHRGNALENVNFSDILQDCWLAGWLVVLGLTAL